MVKTLRLESAIIISVVVLCAVLGPVAGRETTAFGIFHTNPYDRQVSDQLLKLGSPSLSVCAGAAEALGFMRAHGAADELAKAVDDPSASVRRQAAMALAWCGGRREIPALLTALDDADWVVAQAAGAALGNLTGMEFPFDALAEEHLRKAQADVWRRWWAGVPADGVPKDVLDLLKGARLINKANLAHGCDVTVSSIYKGPAEVLTDGATGGGFWQTKGIAFPQHCTIGLGGARKVGCVVVHQYGRGFCMTDYAVSVSADGESYRQILRQKGRSNPRLVISFDPQPARHIRITSYATGKSLYPTTFFE
ncbi:MAG: HEAT repeat domain-containing protein, partial [Planctomycetes bacterium]|nr:HEAT repeat domain-containing protein [Planctomycetota bacterium]